LFGINNQVTVATINGTPIVDAASNWTFDSCLFAWSGGHSVILTAPTSAAADYDMNIVFKNCISFSGADFIRVNTSGAGAFKPGGLDIINCNCMAVVALRVNSANVSTSIPCTVYNSLLTMGGGGTGLIANTSGQILEDYNVIVAPTARSNVTAGLHSTVNQEIYLSMGQEWLYGMLPRPPLSLTYQSVPASFGAQAGGPTTDLLGSARPMGPVRIVASGTATSGAAKSITDTGAAFGTLNGFFVKLTGGTGSGQVKHIDSNTATALTVDSNWITNPDATSTYVVYSNPPASFGKATSGAATTLTVSNATWGTNAWTGYTVEITAGTGVGGIKQVSSNTGTVLTVDSAWSVNPDATSEFKLYRQTNENTINYACGALEAGPFALRETGTVHTGSFSLKLPGPTFYDFSIPVKAVSTTITIQTLFDSSYTGTKPQLKVLNGTEAGVADATTTATGSAGVWEQLSLTFTPATAGIVTIRVQSNSTIAYGSAFFDTFTIAPDSDSTSMDYIRRLEVLPFAASGVPGTSINKGYPPSLRPNVFKPGRPV
jgi:hypothetical protein